jgi:hypothetical protein
MNERIPKNKPIKKAQKPRATRTAPAIMEHDTVMNPENGDDFENSTANVEDGIRDQNNCKSYHKLVKNYLMGKGLTHLFDKHKV